ncbi:hypothetical protein BUALT_BualtUnG0012400 [Buddleja alternifolia]|uniref:Dynamin-type G domain-containing protein n=1 Tax=Buddleja alternifolia TaxID=168488 RepID=A0AAV6W087_9LAMI|nr:hypothetical protein BUALT_BualtUnG0012400 [Buddleja alternifolia]
MEKHRQEQIYCGTRSVLCDLGGVHIRTWEDPWIPTIEGFKPSALPLSDSDKARSYSTRFFVDQASSTWNIDKLHSFFPHNMMSEILKIRIPASLEPRRILWTPSKSGSFSVFSAYRQDQSVRFSEERFGEKILWKRLWKAKLHERLKFFLWKTSVGILPTCDKLLRFMPHIDSLCLLCGRETETINHIFLCCNFSRRLWWSSKWAFRLDKYQNWNITPWLEFILDRCNPAFDSMAQNLEFTTYAAVILASTWKYRNTVLHGEALDSIEALICQVDSRVKELLPCQILKIKKSIRREPDPDLEMLIPSTLIVNVDAPFKDGLMCAGLIVRDVKDSFIFGATIFGHAVDACEAESMAILEACLWLQRANVEDALIQSDCLVAVNNVIESSMELSEEKVEDMGEATAPPCKMGSVKPLTREISSNPEPFHMKISDEQANHDAPIVSSYNDRIRPLLDTMDKLRNLKIMEEGIQLPTIVVVGDQSSGKSSVLESLAGISLPRGQGICTRVPLIMNLQNDPNPDTGAELYLEFDDEKVPTDEDNIADAISSATEQIAGKGKGISNNPLTLIG